MITFDKPQNLDGAKLVEELAAAGIEVKLLKDGTHAVSVTGNVLTLGIDPNDAEIATGIVASHNG